MARRIQRTARASDSGYPTLKDHLKSRRRFLQVAGASMAATTAWAACGRGLGQQSQEPDAGSTDATQPTPDANPPVPGGEPHPDYFTVRIPAQSDLHAWLADGGSARFYLVASTYNAQSHQALVDNFEAVGNRCRVVIEDFTYDQLNTSSGIAAAEDDLADALDTYIQEQNQHNNATIEGVTLTLTYLEPESQLDGFMPEPSYP